MSEDNVEAVREIYERWREGDFRAGAELFDREVAFLLRPEFPDAGTYVGTAAVAEYTRGFLAPWRQITIDAEEIVAAGDMVLAKVRQRGVGAASGVSTEFRYFQLWSFRGRRVIRLENVRERAEALEAAGVSG